MTEHGGKMGSEMRQQTTDESNSDSAMTNNGAQGGLVTPDMLFKLSKKIAQLTKVIYSLNTRNDDLESDLDQIRGSYEDKLQAVQTQLQMSASTLQQYHLDQESSLANGKGLPDGYGLHRVKTPDAERENDARKELKKTKQILKQTEAKVKAMEEEIFEKKQEMDRLHKEARQPSQGGVSDISKLEQKLSSVEQQLKQSNRDKLEFKLLLDHADIQKENFKLERDMLKKDLNEITKEKDALQLQLSAARIQLSYNREMGLNNGHEKPSTSKPPAEADDEFTDELLAKIETLSDEKSRLVRELGEALASQQKLRRDLEQSRLSPILSPELHKPCDEKRASLECKIAQLESSLRDMSDSHEEQLEVIREGRNKAVEDLSYTHNLQIEAMVVQFNGEKLQQANEIVDLQKALADSKVCLDRKCKELASIQSHYEGLCEESNLLKSEMTKMESQLRNISEVEINLKLEMGQNVEKLCSLEDKCRMIERERDDLKRKCKELEAKLDVINKNLVKDTNEKVTQLEHALEEALVEREEILEACEREIQHEKNIAIETEQKMMDDFEWKLREIENEYRNKIREVEEHAKQEMDEFSHKKDADLTRMSISMQREMEEKLRIERTNLKGALDAQHFTDKEAALDRARLENQREIRILQASWMEEKNRLEREIRSLKRRIDELEKESQGHKAEIDHRVQEERKKSELAIEHVKSDIQNFRLEADEALAALRRENAMKMAEYESKLSSANDNRMSSMFQMREEVETEFTERMEQLRNMYMSEIESQTQKMEDEKARSNRTEINLRQLVNEKQQEVDELNSYYQQQGEEYEAKINELLTRLQEQTTLAVKLQAEIDEYEWYDEEEEEKNGGAATSAPQTKRPGSAKPHDHHRIVVEEVAVGPESPVMNHAVSLAGSIASTASYATAGGMNEAAGYLQTPDSQSVASNSPSSSPSQPEPPPRRDQTLGRRSWNQDGPETPQHTDAKLHESITDNQDSLSAAVGDKFVTDDSSDGVRQFPSIRSPSRSSLGIFFQQKLFHSQSTSSGSVLTSTNSTHSSPETKKRSSISSTASSTTATPKKSQCTHQ